MRYALENWYSKEPYIKASIFSNSPNLPSNPNPNQTPNVYQWKEDRRKVVFRTPNDLSFHPGRENVFLQILKFNILSKTTETLIPKNVLNDKDRKRIFQNKGQLSSKDRKKIIDNEFLAQCESLKNNEQALLHLLNFKADHSNEGQILIKRFLDKFENQGCINQRSREAFEYVSTHGLKYSSIPKDQEGKRPVPANTLEELARDFEEYLKKSHLSNLDLNDDFDSYKKIYNFYLSFIGEPVRINEENQEMSWAHVEGYFSDVYSLEFSKESFEEKLLLDVLEKNNINATNTEFINFTFTNYEDAKICLSLFRDKLQHKHNDISKATVKNLEDRYSFGVTKAQYNSLLELRQSIKEKNKVQDFFSAINEKNFESVKKSISNDTSLLRKKNSEGLTPLNALIKQISFTTQSNEKSELLSFVSSLLIQYQGEYDLLTPDNTGNTMLHRATLFDMPEIIENILMVALNTKELLLSDLFLVKNNEKKSPLDNDKPHPFNKLQHGHLQLVINKNKEQILNRLEEELSQAMLTKDHERAEKIRDVESTIKKNKEDNELFLPQVESNLENKPSSPIPNGKEDREPKSISKKHLGEIYKYINADKTISKTDVEQFNSIKNSKTRFVKAMELLKLDGKFLEYNQDDGLIALISPTDFQKLKNIIESAKNIQPPPVQKTILKISPVKNNNNTLTNTIKTIMDKIMKNVEKENRYQHYSFWSSQPKPFSKATYVQNAYTAFMNNNNDNQESSIEKFKIFIICCMQNKKGNDWHNSKSTKTGEEILDLLNQHQHSELKTLFFPKKDKIAYKELATLLFNDQIVNAKAQELIADTNPAKKESLTIEQWVPKKK